MKKRKIYLVRHGKPELESDKKIYIGKTDLDLSDVGIEQAIGLGEKLKMVDFEKIYCSDLIRTQKTAAFISEYQKKSLNIMKDLSEIDLGDWEGLSFEEVKKKYPDEFRKRGEAIITYYTPNGESFLDLNKRVIKAFNLILENTEKDLLIVAHAGVNRLILCQILNRPIEKIFEIPQVYACVNIIEQEDNRLKVTVLNSESVNEKY